ncbi:hypothetical protein DM860_007579 [Cuscuta australis]|uniref:Uncharacterized protein n=1 Tax=Cuscuta australis TaxID=267555 RepID=A0A328E8N7_9ASTE|nr:hypothetical protein DM860_007579 [Cuscuta australis]
MGELAPCLCWKYNEKISEIVQQSLQINVLHLDFCKLKILESEFLIANFNMYFDGLNFRNHLQGSSFVLAFFYLCRSIFASSILLCQYDYAFYSQCLFKVDVRGLFYFCKCTLTYALECTG